jgi:hypothetical protein
LVLILCLNTIVHDVFRLRLLCPPLRLQLHNLAKTVALLNFPMWVLFLGFNVKIFIFSVLGLSNFLLQKKKKVWAILQLTIFYEYLLGQFLLTFWQKTSFNVNFLLVSLNFSMASLKSVFNHKVTNNTWFMKWLIKSCNLEFWWWN